MALLSLTNEQLAALKVNQLVKVTLLGNGYQNSCVPLLCSKVHDLSICNGLTRKPSALGTFNVFPHLGN